MRAGHNTMIARHSDIHNPYVTTSEPLASESVRVEVVVAHGSGSITFMSLNGNFTSRLLHVFKGHVKYEVQEFFRVVR